MNLSNPITRTSYSPRTGFYFLTYASYSLASISPSNSLTSLTLIFRIHPSCSGLLLIKLGLSVSFWFVSTIVPETGDMMSEADLTDSTAPETSPAATSVSMLGSSTKTASPRAWAAKAVMPTVAVARGGRLVGRRRSGRGGGWNRCQRR